MEGIELIKRNLWLAVLFVLILTPLIPVMETLAQVPSPMEITVDSTLDAPDIETNLECYAGVSGVGQCTLRAAIDEANECTLADCTGIAKINIPPGTYILTLAPSGDNDNSTGDLDISPLYGIEALIIEGTDATNPSIIDANGLDRVFHIYNTDIPVTLRNLIIRGGTLISADENNCLVEGAGVSNYGHLTLENVIVENNQILCAATNFSDCEGVGGGINTGGSLLIKTSTVRNNTAFVGGGIFTSSPDEVAILSSTISGNFAAFGGGGILNFGELLQIENSTISDNTSDSFGGIFNLGTMNLFNVTIASNTATGVEYANLYNSGTINISNSIITYPIGPYPTKNCSNSGNWNTLGVNIYSDSSCVAGADDLINTDPNLTPLAWLGGPTMTRGLLESSPAHDAVNGSCNDFNINPLTTDQRGVSRDSFCDIGAFEGVAYEIFLPSVSR